MLHVNFMWQEEGVKRVLLDRRIVLGMKSGMIVKNEGEMLLGLWM